MNGLPSLHDFRAAFREPTGVLPDGEVVGSERADCAAVLRLLDESGWPLAWSGDTAGVVQSELLDSERDGGVFAVSPVSGVRVNFFAGPEVLFDIDLREIVSAESMNAVYGVMALLGTACGKPVTLSSEGDWDDVIVRYDPKTDDFSLRESVNPVTD